MLTFNTEEPNPRYAKMSNQVHLPSPEEADFEIILGSGTVFPCFRATLMAQSDYFAGLFSTQSAEQEQGRVHLDQFKDDSAFRLLLESIHSQRSSFASVPLDQLLAVYPVAMYLQMKQICHRLLSRFQECLNAKTCLRLGHVLMSTPSSLAYSEVVLANVKSYMRAHFNDVCNALDSDGMELMFKKLFASSEQTAI
jgi:hypothetical protein